MYEYQLGIYEKAMPDEMPLEDKLLCAKELGYDAGFGPGKFAEDVISFAVNEMMARNMK